MVLDLIMFNNVLRFFVEAFFLLDTWFTGFMKYVSQSRDGL